jgi:hypothetical protein
MANIHRLPGRLRVRSSVLKRNPKKASELLTAIGSRPGVRDIEINIVTGSVLVYYDPLRVSGEELDAALRAHGIFATTPTPSPERSLAGSVAKAVFASVLQHVIERSIGQLLPMLL